MTEPIATDPAAERFYDGALERIRRFIRILGAVGIVVCLVFFGRVVTTRIRR